MKTSFLSPEELKAVGFKAIGRDVLVSRSASIYSPQTIELADHIRIDDFCILSGQVSLGRHVHIGAYSALFGSDIIRIEDYAGLSSRVTIYTATDDYFGKGLTNPTIPEKYRHVTKGPVHLGRHAIIGASVVILPGVTVGQGAAIGAMSLVARSIPSWKIAKGIPARARIPRRKDVIESLQRKMEMEEKNLPRPKAAP